MLVCRETSDNYFEKPENRRTIMVMGLEGSGKTTLINKLCGTEFDTGSCRDGYPVGDNQFGSFTLTPFDIRIDLHDTNGLRNSEPGEWQKRLRQLKGVNGVIFFIDGHNQRDSLLGDLPRLIEYCYNLQLKLLFLFRTAIIDEWKSKYDNSFLVKCEIEESKNVTYKEPDLIKKIIMDTFRTCTESIPLIDPIQLGKLIKEIKNGHEKTVNKLEAEHKSALQRNGDEIRHLQGSRDELRNDLNQANIRCNEANHRCFIAQSTVQTLETAKNGLMADIQQLRTLRSELLQNLRISLNPILDIDVTQARLHVTGKKHGWFKPLSALPGFGYIASNHYEELGEKFATVVNGIVDQLQQFGGLQDEE